VEKLVKDFLGAYFEMGFFLFCFFFRSLIFNQRLDLIAFMLFFFFRMCILAIRMYCYSFL
jgi:hypothetical protein